MKLKGIYHRTLSPQGKHNFTGSEKTLKKKREKNREVMIWTGSTFVGNLRETFKF